MKILDILCHKGFAVVTIVLIDLVWEMLVKLAEYNLGVFVVADDG